MFRNMRWVTIASILLVAGLVLGACGTPAPPPPAETAAPGETPAPTTPPAPACSDTVIVGMSQEPDSLYLMASTMAVSVNSGYAVFEPFHFEKDYDMQNNLFEEDLPTLENGMATLDDGGTPDDSSDDQLTMNYTIKQGIYWCDGEEVTAEDFVFMYETANDPNSGIADRSAIDNIESYEAVGDYSFTVTLTPGVLDPLYSLAYDPINNRGPFPKHLWSDLTPAEMVTAEKVARLPCGWGPYYVTEWEAGDHITMEKNPYYYRKDEGVPCAETLIFRIIEDINQLLAQLASGDIDVATSDALQATQAALYASFEAQGLINVYELPSPTWEHIDFNLWEQTTVDSTSRFDKPHPILKELAVRQAMAYCTDRQAMVDNIYAGKSAVMNTMVPQTQEWAYAGDENITLYPYDPEEGMRLLEEAGWVDADGDGIREKDGVKLSLTIRTTSGNVMRERLTQLLQSNQADCGIDIVIDLLPGSVWFGDTTGLVVGDFELGEYAWVGEIDPGGRTLWACDTPPGPVEYTWPDCDLEEGCAAPTGWTGQNYMGWCNPTATEAIVQATERHLLREERQPYYLTLQQEYTKDVPSLPLFNRLEIFGSTPDMQNIEPNPTDYVTWNVADWLKPPAE